MKNVQKSASNEANPSLPSLRRNLQTGKEDHAKSLQEIPLQRTMGKKKNSNAKQLLHQVIANISTRQPNVISSYSRSLIFFLLDSKKFVEKIRS